MSNAITLVQSNGEARVDSRLIAEQALLLGELAELALTAPDDALTRITREIPARITHESLLFLRLAVFDQAVATQKVPRFTEFDVHKQVFGNLDAYLPGAVRLERKSDPSHIPDGWVEINGEPLPVEIKRDAFTKASARQLARYIEHYGSSRGVAVASSFNCAPDPRFICITHDMATAGGLLLEEVTA